MSGTSSRVIAWVVMALVAVSSGRLSAHEVPSDATVEVFARPVDQRLVLLIRVPLSGLLGTSLPKEGVGYLALDGIQPLLQDTARRFASMIEIDEDGRLLTGARVGSTRISLPFDSSFASYDAAFAHVTGPPLPVDTQVYWLQGYVDAVLEYPIRSDRSRFSMRANFTALAPQVTTSLRFLPPGQPVRSFEFVGDAGRIWFDPQWYRVAADFVWFGLRHTLGLPDQWLFVLCLLIPWWQPRDVATVIASFIVGGALADLVVTYGPDATGSWLPALIATAATAALLYLALENIVGALPDRRRLTTLIYGVISGVASSIAMRQIAQFSGPYGLTSLVSFELGVGVGTVAALAVLMLPLLLLYRFFKAERLRIIILSALVANVAWNAFIDRAKSLPDQQWPLLTPKTLETATSWLLVLVVAAGVVWIVAGLRVLQRQPPPHAELDAR